MFKVSAFFANTVLQSDEVRSLGQQQPFCEHGESEHCLVETRRKVQILNEWLAKDGCRNSVFRLYEPFIFTTDQ